MLRSRNESPLTRTYQNIQRVTTAPLSRDKDYAHPMKLVGINVE